MLRTATVVPCLFAILSGSQILAADDADSKEIHFANDVIPILSRYGCNTSGCHGKAEGQNGFKLSVFGFDPAADYTALTQESRGRRVLPSIPDKSLLLLKASGGMPHGGGVRILKGTDEYRLLRTWIASGMPIGRENAPQVASIRVTPAERILAFRAKQQLHVTAIYSDGHEVDVTHHSRFQSNRESIATVDQDGEVSIQDVAGDVAVMAAYLDCNAVFTALVPRDELATSDIAPPAINDVDRLVDMKLNKLHIVASPLCDDATYLRRVYLDLIGRLPSPQECRDFLANQQADKRAQVVERLFTRPEFADYWALIWSDWLRVDRQALGHNGAYAYYKWIRDSFASNKPMDRFATELIEADGLVSEHPAAQFYRVAKDPGDAAAMLSQALLGVRIECAKCHHHPFDRWSQDDYFGMQAFFTPLTFKTTPHGEMLLASKADATRHSRTGAEMYAHPLGTTMPIANPDGDRRKVLAAWMTAPANPFFARNIANRTWAHFLGRGIVEPVDDVRSTNPPTNPQLLDALANSLTESHFDLRQLMRQIIASRTYQASTTVNTTNANDEQNYSRALLRRLSAEVLLDAICDSTGVSEKFAGVPVGSRAVQLWDSQATSYFLTTTGRPSRTTVCECERVASPTVAQVLHTLNSANLEGKISHDTGLVAKTLHDHPQDDSAMITEIYLAFVSRLPTDAESQRAAEHFAKAGSGHRQSAAEDLAWALMNSLEFIYNH
ncbi:MAG TPA: DUF1549 domain-containing protein [Schlesneria sp.]|jgi:hypothetical protein